MSLPPSSVIRLTIDKRISPAFGGRSFGKAGQYELILGRVHVVLDPKARQNAIIAGIDKAPVNRDGAVEYSTQLAILRPVDLAKGSGNLVYEVINRSLSAIDPEGKAMGGPLSMTEYLLERGDIAIAAAWQGELGPNRNNPFSPALLAMVGGFPLYADLPLAYDSGKPVVARVRQELEAFDGFTGAANSRAVLLYPAAADSDLRVLSRRHEGDAPVPVPATSYRLVDPRTLEIRSVPGAMIYDIIYNATEPFVSGIGLAVPRDLISFLRHDPGDGAERINPLLGADGKPAVRHAYAYGISQSGRYLRTFLWQGFNEDGAGRPVFDGLIPTLAGGKKGYFNRLFAQPGTIPGELAGHRDTAIWPFAYPVLDDPLSGAHDGILKRCQETGTCPKIIHIDTENEVVGGYGWLLTTAPQGGPISQQPENLRLYALAGSDHGLGGWRPSTPLCRATIPAPVPMTPFLRGAIAAMDEWVRLGRAPPPSRYPSLVDGTLTTIDKARAAWPAIPGFPFVAAQNAAEHWVHGDPLPRSTGRYPLFTVTRDADGNMTGGVAHPWVAVPTGTLSGVGERRADRGPEDICPLAGEYLSFARTRAERGPSGDPRPSLEERYPGGDAELLKRRREAAEKLVADRYILPADVAAAATGSLDEGARALATITGKE